MGAAPTAAQRAGTALDKLASATIRVLQRETRLDRQIYDGSFSRSPLSHFHYRLLWPRGKAPEKVRRMKSSDWSGSM